MKQCTLKITSPTHALCFPNVERSELLVPRIPSGIKTGAPLHISA